MGPRGMRIGSGEDLTIKNFIVSAFIRVIKYRTLRGADHEARMEEGRSAFKILKGKPTGNKPSGKPRRRWEGNVTMNVKEIGNNTRS